MNRRDVFKTLPALAALPLHGAAGRGRLRSAICAYSFRQALQAKTMSYEDLVHRAVEWDVEGLDLTVYWFPNTSDAFLLPLKRLAYRNGVEIYSISVRTEMTQPTAEGRDKELADLRKWIDVAAKLGAGHIRVFGGRVPKGASVEQAAGWATDVLKQAAPYAAEKGVILGLENHGGVTELADTILGIVKRVDSPWVAVNLDTGNFNRDAYTQIENLIPYAANVQVKMEIRGAGGGREESDWARIVKMLVAGGYKGYLALEYEAKEPAETAVPRLIEKLNRLVRAA